MYQLRLSVVTYTLDRRSAGPFRSAQELCYVILPVL